jgi:hypothetical protein
MPELTHEQTLLLLRTQMREAVRHTQKFDRKWNEINDAINDKFAREDERRAMRGDYQLTDLMKAEMKADSLPLKDAFAAGQWWRGKAVYLATVIQAEIELENELGLLRAARQTGRAVS